MKIKKQIKKSIDEAILEKGQKNAQKNFILHTYYENNTIFSLIHVSDDSTSVDQNASLIGHFEFNDKMAYLNYKKAVGGIFKTLYEKGNKVDVESFVQRLKSSQESLGLNGWFNPQFLKTAPENKNKAPYKPSEAGYANKSKKQKVDQIKPVVLLDTLQQMGVIDVKNVSPNTTGEEFWHYSINDGNSAYDFKTSVKTKNYIINHPSSSKSNIFNDVYNSSKGYGMGSVGLLAYLGSHGLFKDPLTGKENDRKRYERALNYLHDEVLPNVPKELLVEQLQDQEEIVELDNYSRLPFKKKGKEEETKKFLRFRGISDETINELFETEKVYNGFFSQNSFEKGHKLHFNQTFFNLLDKNDQPAGAERFKLTEKADGSFDAAKFNTAKVAGNAYKLRGKTPKMTIFTEAIIDDISQYELIKKAGLPTQNYNCFSVQGCGHLNNWFQKNLGFGFELNEDFQQEYGRVFSVSENEKHEKLSPAEKEKYKKALAGYDIYYVSVNNEADQYNRQKMNELEEALGVKINIIEKQYRSEYIDYNSFDKKKSVFVDNTNFENFFKVNGLDFTFDAHDKEFSLKKYKIELQKETLNPQNIEQIKETMMEKLGCCDIALAFDNDEAGLKYTAVTDYLEKDLGIKAYNCIPDQIKPETDLNDVLKTFNSLINEQKSEKAYELLENHIKKIEPDFEFKKKVENERPLTPKNRP